MSSHVEQIKERLSIVDVVSSYIKLDKAGVNFKAKCPFHNEKTPSFTVSPSRSTFYCFGCGAKGDIFSFIEQFEGTDFKGALKVLADRAGVELRPIDKKAEDAKTRLYNVLEEATSFFEKTFTEHPEAASYLKKRGITKEMISLWRIGYALPEWRSLKEFLLKHEYTEAELLAAGLIKEKGGEGGSYDRFRGRIIFPIMDSSGRVIAYTGRILPDPKNSEYKEEIAKYLNSPETRLFEKSHILYGYHRAKHSIRKHDFSILVEGQMDVVLSHQAGFSNTVASSGTALTNEQVSLLSRLSNNLIMAFDADNAGVAAGGRGIDLALAQGMDVKVAALPKGKDPADLVKENKDLWKGVIREAKHVVDFYLDYLAELHSDPRKLRLTVGQIVIPYIARIPNNIDQAHFVSRVASHLSLPENPIWESVRNETKQQKKERGKDTTLPPVTIERIETMSRQNIIAERLVGILLWQKSTKKNLRQINTEAIEKKLSKVLGLGSLKKHIEHLQKENEEVLFQVEHLYEGVEDLSKEIEELCSDFAKEMLKERYQRALHTLKQAEERGVVEEVNKALLKCRELSEAIEK